MKRFYLGFVLWILIFLSIGVSPSGKAGAFEAPIRRFESYYPSQFELDLHARGPSQLQVKCLLLIYLLINMSNQNKGGDLVFRAGDGSSSGNGGDLHIGPGNYRAGDATQTINYRNIIDSLVVDINNSDLSQERKGSLLEKIKNGVSMVVDISTLTKLIASLFI